MCIQILELKVQVNKPFRHSDEYLAANPSSCLLVASTKLQQINSKAAVHFMNFHRNFQLCKNTALKSHFVTFFAAHSLAWIYLMEEILLHAFVKFIRGEGQDEKDLSTLNVIGIFCVFAGSDYLCCLKLTST